MVDHVSNMDQDQKNSILKFAFNYKWLLLLGYYFFFDLGQEFWELNSDERLDFYFINQSAFFLILCIYLIQDGKLIMNKLTHFFYKGALVYFVWDLLDNIVNSGARIYQSEAMAISGIIILILILDLSWSVIYKKTILESFYELIKSLIKT